MFDLIRSKKKILFLFHYLSSLNFLKMTFSNTFLKSILHKIIILTFLLSITSCSLMKLSFESEEIPLEKTQLNTRIAVRSFQNDFSSAIIRVSDSIKNGSNDIEIKLNSIRFKKGLVAASGKTAFQTVPELSLVDTWILCKQLVAVLQTEYGMKFLGPQNKLMLDTANDLELKITHIAKSLLKKERFAKLNSFVIKNAMENPVKSFDFPRTNLLSPLSTHLGVADTSYVKTIGSGAEVLSDIGDRIAIAKEQITQQLSWEKERLTIQWGDVDPSEEILKRADSLNIILNKFALLAQDSPELLGAISSNIRNELMPLIYELNGGLNSSIYKLADERVKMQLYLDELQIKLVADINTTGEHMMEKTATSISTVIKEVAWIVILGVVTLILLLFGIPFMAGFYLAKARFKNSAPTRNT